VAAFAGKNLFTALSCLRSKGRAQLGIRLVMEMELDLIAACQTFDGTLLLEITLTKKSMGQRK
jgi:hypothetical protein